MKKELNEMTTYELERVIEDRRRKERPLSNINVMDYLVIICIITVIAFVSVNLYYYYTKEIPPTLELMQYFFAFFGGELLAMATITITKNVKKNRPASRDNNHNEEE